ncbi:MAG: IS21 family transposase [Bacteroidales bacterium]|jgi:transposase|nr:IS21 family transposase [Bacteroidales bacterium]
MAGKTTRMSKIKQLLRLHESGVSNRQIAKTLSLDRDTVNNYIRKLKSGGMQTKELLELEDPVLENKFIAGTAAYTDKRFDDFKELLPWFEKELGRKHVTRKLLWQEYLSQYPSGYRFTQFCYHLSQRLVARQPSAILTHEAGRELFVDFAGDRLEYIVLETGEVVPVYVFVACLPFSEYTFTMAVRNQTTEDFLYALNCCLKDLGGSPKILVPDNLKAAVIKADRYEPELNRVMEDFANHYGFAVIPARPHKPKDKAMIENHVRIIYSRVYAKLRNHHFFSLEELNRALADRTMEHNQTRMQRNDYSRQEKFLADEKHLLQPLPETEFEIKNYTELRVGLNNYIYLGRDKHYYSVPHIYTGSKVQVIYTRTLVKIFCKGESIATHERSLGFGYTTVTDHLCSAHQYYSRRSPDYYIEMAKRKSAALSEIITYIFNSSKPPEIFYKTCDGLLGLCRKTEPARFEKACMIALEAGKFSYKFIKSLVEGKSLLMEMEEYKPLPLPQDNVRGKQYYK